MDDVLVAMADQFDELAGMLGAMQPDQWHLPSRCEGWTVTDVVLHLAQTNEMAQGSLTGRFDEVLDGLLAGWVAGADPPQTTTEVEDGAGRMVELGRGAPAEAVHDRWTRSVDDLNAAFGSCDLHQRVTWVAGQLAARTLATTRLAETWIHTGDVAAALGIDQAPSDRLEQIARLAWRTLPYAFSGAGRELAGPVAFDLVGPAGDRWAFLPDGEVATTVGGPAVELCLVAARRLAPVDTSLTASGPDADVVLALVRTFA